MAKGDSKKVSQAVQQQRSTQQAQQNQIMPMATENYINSRADDQLTRAEIEDRFRNYNPNYDANKYLSPQQQAAAIASSGGGGGGGGGGLKAGGINLGKISGGIDPSAISSMGADPYAGYKKMSEGLRPEFWGDFNKYMGQFDTAGNTLNEALTGYRGLAETGGMTPEQMAIYDPFYNTGGFSEADLGNIRSRSLAPSRSIYQGAQDNLSTAMARSGMNPGAYGATQRKLTRQANEDIGNLARATEADISQQVQQGKQFGATGKAGLAAQQQQGKIAGTQGIAQTGVSQAQLASMQADARTAVEQLDQQMRAQGLGGMTDIEKSRLQAQLTNQQITQQGQIATNQGILSKAQIEAQKASARASSGAASAARRQQQAQFEATMRFNADQATNRDTLAGQSAWTDLYGTVPGATALTGSQLAGFQNQFAGQGSRSIADQIAGTQVPSDWSQAMGNIGAGLGVAGQVGGLLAGFGGGGGTSGIAGYGYPSDENGNIYR